MGKYSITIILLLSFSFSQTTSGVASFLKRGFSPKWSSLEGSSITFVDGSPSLLLNPSGLVNSSKIGFNGSYVKEKVFDDVNFQQLGMHFSNLQSFGIGVCISQARVGGIDQYDENANYIGKGMFNEWVALVGMAFSITDLDIGISNIYYHVDNLGLVNNSDLELNKGRMVLGMRYDITKNLNVGVVIKNNAELLPGEYMEGAKKLGIGYSYHNNLERNLFNLGGSYSKIKNSGFLSFGFELIPLKNLSIRGSYCNLEVHSEREVSSQISNQNVSFGLGYTFYLNEKTWVEISYATKLNTYPSIMEALADPLSKNDMVGISISLH